MYVASAMCFDLEITSNDGDIPKILGLYSEMIDWKEKNI